MTVPPSALGKLKTVSKEQQGPLESRLSLGTAMSWSVCREVQHGGVRGQRDERTRVGSEAGFGGERAVLSPGSREVGREVSRELVSAVET